MPPVNSITSTSELPHPHCTAERWVRPWCRSLVTLSAISALACGSLGCASLPAGAVRDPRDPIERFNRTVYKFNTALDHAMLRPVARGYVKVTPQPVRTGVTNFLTNLRYTKVIGNDLFQAQFHDFGTDISRLVVNTSVGIGGVFDPATRFGLEKHERDFGQTLGKWGVPTGTYLMLPVLGPSDVRDACGLIPDRFMTIDGQINDTTVLLSLTALGAVDGRAKSLPLDKAFETAYDPYALLRSVWFQRRDYKVRGESGTEPIVPGHADE
jgi:phospholipid-binding lipoprotein MlaA